MKNWITSILALITSQFQQVRLKFCFDDTHNLGCHLGHLELSALGALLGGEHLTFSKCPTKLEIIVSIMPFRRSADDVTRDRFREIYTNKVDFADAQGPLRV